MVHTRALHVPLHVQNSAVLILPDNRMVYEYCVTKHTPSSVDIQGEELYVALSNFYNQLSRLPPHPDALLPLWTRYRDAAPRVEAIFQYLDRFWVARNSKEHIIPMLWRAWGERLEEGRLLAWMEGCLTLERINASTLSDSMSNETLREIIGIYRKGLFLIDFFFRLHFDDPRKLFIISAKGKNTNTSIPGEIAPMVL